MQDIDDMVDYLSKIEPEDRARPLREYLRMAWLEGLDFAGDALRGGASLTEAATANPYAQKTVKELEQDRLAAAWDEGQTSGGGSNPYRRTR